jgi:surface carbohydrate biosynthesis protein
VIKKIILIFKLLFLVKKKFEMPKKNRVVLYRCNGKELLNKYIKENISILDPFNEIYFFVLIKSLFNFSFKNILLNYNKTFITMTKPKFVFTYIDNDLKFYFLKDFFEGIKFISIQNGIRGGINDRKYKKNYIDSMEEFNLTVSKNQSLKCDFILTFNKDVSKKYNKFIKAKTLVIGSIKNNIFKIKKYKNINILSFICETSINQDFDKKVFFDNNKYKITLSDWLLAEKKIVPFLAEYCEKKNLKFQIITKGNSKYEKLFYENLIKDKFKYTIITKKNYLQGYELVDKSNYIVSIGSSLAYEALSRKKKVAFLPIRKEILTNKGFNLDFSQYDFGWPSKFRQKGFFWSHSNNFNEINRVLNFLTNVSDKKWLKLINDFKNNFKIPHNNNNTVFVNFLKNLGVNTNGRKIKILDNNEQSC